uniref:Tubulin-specific chaperone E n=1 Tax=Trichuris muris TaxID=70415 RepID=A0A5S6QYR0_TRIMR
MSQAEGGTLRMCGMLSAVLMLKSAMANCSLHSPKIPNVLVGCRVRYLDARGTVKFHGYIEGVDGRWIGIDWDEDDRGKHDGSHRSVQYFKARGPRSGSFMRPASVQYGCSLFDAIESRDWEAAGDSNGEPGVIIHVSRKGASVEEYLKRLNILLLDNSLVSHVGINEKFENAFVNITELDISRTLVIDWKEIISMLRLMPNLRELNLRHNKLNSPVGVSEETVCFKSIVTLVLSRTDYSWKEVEILATIFPNVENLWLSYNHVDCLGDEIAFTSVRLLGFEANPLPQWKEVVVPLGSLKSLQTLYLGRCNLTEIRIPEVDTHPLFPSLEVLDLSENSIDDWGCFDELNKLPNLKCLIVRRNPICSSVDEATCRQLIIARIKKLKVLNRVEISPAERRGAEIDYLQYFGNEWRWLNDHEGESCAPADFHSRHPRYAELVEMHGPPTEVVPKSNILKDKLITLNFTYLSQPPMRKRILRTTTIGKVKVFAGQLFRIDPRSVRLSYKDASRPNVTVPLDCDLMEITFYSVEDEVPAFRPTGSNGSRNARVTAATLVHSFTWRKPGRHLRCVDVER